MSDTLLIRNVAVGDEHGLDVRVGSETVLAIGRSLPRRRAEPVLDGRGGAVIPGLHDHHAHLRAAVAARKSIDVSGAASPSDFDRMIAAAAAGAEHSRWLRVTGWHDHAGSSLDRYRLDALTGPLPARVQHRSGAMWVLNSAALKQAGIGEGDLPPGAERDEYGVSTGRLLRLDGWLRARLPAAADSSFADDLASYAADAARLGVTGFTDATPDRDQADVAEFAGLSAAGLLPQRLVLMAQQDVATPGTGRVSLGARKFILDDTTLPDVAEFADTIRAAHRAGSVVAIHCVTAEQLIVTVAALDVAGVRFGDRIEHAALVPPGFAAKLASLGVAVVTQPGFIAVRGDDYLRDVDPVEQAWLYPCATLLKCGVTVAAGTDAPFGPADPWRCIAAAMSRRTPDGQVIGPGERVSADHALTLFLAMPDDLRRVRTVAPGQPSDLCLLHVPRRDVLAEPSAAMVRGSVIGTSFWAGRR